MKDVSLKDLLEAGCHFGHHTNRWHPKANSFIYGDREGVHIIDLVKTRDGLLAAGQFLSDLANSGGTVLFVGIKRQAQPILLEGIARVVEKVPTNPGFFHLADRWPGGVLTNFDVIKRNNLDAILKLSDDIANNNFVTKKEKLLASRKLEKYQKVYGGLVGLEKLPDAVFFVDIKKENGALMEAVRTGTKVVAIVDTNTNPEPVNFPIPANDDAVGSIKIVMDYLIDCWIEGRNEAKNIKPSEIPSEVEGKKKVKKKSKKDGQS
jgi:small subunit ribosomal protein S2